MAVVVGAGAARALAAALLTRAGFGLCGGGADGHAQAAQLGDAGAVVVLLATGEPPERARAVQTLADAHPDAAIVVAMPRDAPNSALRRALRAGAAGIVLDGELDHTLVATAQAVAAGQLAVPRSLRGHVAPRALSYREKEILGLVVRGLTNREIAGELYLAESTVKTHLSSAFAKLDAHSRAEAAALVLDPESGYGAAILAINNGASVPVS